MIGGALAAWAVDAIVAFGPRGLPRIEDISVDRAGPRVHRLRRARDRASLFGFVPAFHAAKTELGQMLKENVRGTSGRRATQRTRSMLVVTEMALAVVLLVGAGLLIRSFVKLVAGRSRVPRRTRRRVQRLAYPTRSTGSIATFVASPPT